MFRAIWSLWWRWFNGPYDLGGGGGVGAQWAGLLWVLQWTGWLMFSVI